MKPNFLLTSFQTWLPHHQSNASDDLLKMVADAKIDHLNLNFLRKLPVDTEKASQQAIAHITIINPDQIICCGMAEKRDQLTIESNATINGERLETSVDLENLVSQLSVTEISHDAGKFVCEGLYYQILNYLRQFKLPSACIFVHVPVLTPQNLNPILGDFLTILQTLSQKK
jgi:pyroglutamyl-peptidase